MVGVLRPSKDAVTGMVNGGIGYTCLLTEYVVEHCNESDAVRAQIASPGTDILSGLPFRDSSTLTDRQKAQAFRDCLHSMNEAQKAACYATIMSTPGEEVIQQAIQEYISSYSGDSMKELLMQTLSAQMNVDEETIAGYLSDRSDEEILTMMAQALSPQITARYTEAAEMQLARMTDRDRIRIARRRSFIMSCLPSI